MKKVQPVLLSFFLIMCLTACSLFSFDASGYTKACLDATLHGDFTEYAEFVDVSVEDAQKDFDETLEMDISRIFNGITLNDDLKQKYKELLKEIYAQCKYEVGEASTNEDGSYSVPVTTQKLIVFKGVAEATDKQLKKFKKNSKKSPSMDELTEKYLQLTYDELTKNLKSVTYEDPQVITITVQAATGNSRVYQIAREDYTKLYTALMDMNAMFVSTSE
ncbi:MAG: hypothetical protein J1F02_04255 [Lachnospiraceae bacterium]|nr:hypothetical protein [Lachnospiraceae bacterium]